MQTCSPSIKPSSFLSASVTSGGSGVKPLERVLWWNIHLPLMGTGTWLSLHLAPYGAWPQRGMPLVVAPNGGGPTYISVVVGHEVSEGPADHWAVDLSSRWERWHHLNRELHHLDSGQVGVDESGMSSTDCQYFPLSLPFPVIQGMALRLFVLPFFFQPAFLGGTHQHLSGSPSSIQNGRLLLGLC